MLRKYSEKYSEAAVNASNGKIIHQQSISFSRGDFAASVIWYYSLATGKDHPFGNYT